jgi:hypothetical protein
MKYPQRLASAGSGEVERIEVSPNMTREDSRCRPIYRVGRSSYPCSCSTNAVALDWR